VKKPLSQRTFTHLILIVILGLIAYSNTFHVPFQFDDITAIVQNPVIKDLSFFTDPSQSRGYGHHFGYHTFRSRYIGYLTFALNYHLHGLDVTGYHIVNLLIHFSTSLLVYFLVRLTFKTPFFRNSRIMGRSDYIALFTALIFVSHPVQTEAVTYIWQRVASLAAMLYVLSLFMYIKWRLLRYQPNSPESRGYFGVKSVTYYLISLISSVLAMKTKQTAFTLPVAIALYEFISSPMF
jgi:hypothetical protein